MIGLDDWTYPNYFKDNPFFGLDRFPFVQVGDLKVYMDRNVSDLEGRSWKERLFSFPWRPFKKYNEIERMFIININEKEKIGICSMKTYRKIENARSAQSKT